MTPGLLVGVLALIVQAEQPGPGRGVRGEVVRADGTRVPDAQVQLVCGAWRGAAITGVDGRFAFTDVPDVRCALRITMDDASDAVTRAVPAGELTDLRVRVGAGQDDASLAETAASDASPDDQTPPIGQRLRVADDSASAAPTATGPTWRVGSTASWNGADPLAPPGPDSWRMEMTAAGTGPKGLRFEATSRVRRQLGASTLLNDVTATDTPGTSAWSSLYDPTSSPTIWDVRFRVDRTFTTGGVEITPFGEGYYSFQRHLAPDAPASALPASGRTLRTGGALRGGVKIGF